MKRYDLEYSHNFGHNMEETPIGDFVKYKDLHRTRTASRLRRMRKEIRLLRYAFENAKSVVDAENLIRVSLEKDIGQLRWRDIDCCLGSF